jgi:hypothetical protein
MGFLQNTTNNIIIDCVLTDYGRRALSRNDGSFSIIKFGLGDEEVDYTLLTQYGTQVGKEKIIKNTPIFEATTSAMYGIRSHLLSSAAITTNIGFLKNVTTDGPVSLDLISNKSKVVTIEQQTSSGNVIPSDLTNQVYIVKLDNKFLGVRGRTPRSVSSNQQAHYFINRDDILSNTNGSTLSLDLEVKSNITSATFNTYGTTSTSNLIRTFATITGKESGQSLTIEVKISKS